jgi:hypothetical protein
MLFRPSKGDVVALGSDPNDCRVTVPMTPNGSVKSLKIDILNQSWRVAAPRMGVDWEYIAGSLSALLHGLIIFVVSVFALKNELIFMRLSLKLVVRSFVGVSCYEGFVRVSKQNIDKLFL